MCLRNTVLESPPDFRALVSSLTQAYRNKACNIQRNKKGFLYHAEAFKALDLVQELDLENKIQFKTFWSNNKEMK